MLISPEMRDAARARRPLVTLVWIDHPDGEVFLWSGVGTLDYDGHEWRGAGLLGTIETVPRTSELRIDEVRLRLSGVQPETLSTTTLEVRNRLARVWIAALDDANRVVGVPILQDEILLDYGTDSLAEDGTITLTLVGNTGFWTLERSTENAWSAEEAISRFGRTTAGTPVETGYDFITSLRVKDTKWAVG